MARKAMTSRWRSRAVGDIRGFRDLLPDASASDLSERREKMFRGDSRGFRGIRGKRVVYGVLDGKIRVRWGGMGRTWDDVGGMGGVLLIKTEGFALSRDARDGTAMGVKGPVLGYVAVLTTPIREGELLTSRSRTTSSRVIDNFSFTR